MKKGKFAGPLSRKNEGFDVVRIGGGSGDPIGPLAAAFGRAQAGPRLPAASAGPVETSSERGSAEGLRSCEQGEQVHAECPTPSTKRR